MWIGALLAPAADAQACPGDCDGDGTVSVAELIQGVRMALGEASDCQAFGRPVDIAALVRAVNAALNGCPPAPTATPFPPTPTAAPTETSTSPPTETPAALATETPTEVSTEKPEPSPTPTAVAVAGRWREDPLAVTASTCPGALVEPFALEIAARPSCVQTITEVGEGTAILDDCTGASIAAAVERDGTIRAAYPVIEGATGGCSVGLVATVVIPAADSPTAAAYTFAVELWGDCIATAPCVIEASAPWTRVDPPALSGGGTGSSPTR